MSWLEDDGEGRDFRVANARPTIPARKCASYGLATPPELKILALEWAKQWLNVPGKMDVPLAVADLDRLLGGSTLRKGIRGTEEEQIVRMASKALYHWRAEANQERTKRGFPWLTFVAIAGFDFCPAAAQRNGQLVAYEDREPIPLPGCTAGRCDCHYLQRTKGWVARHAANHDL